LTNVVGHCGSAYDNTVFKDSRTMQENDQLFKRGNNAEWIWADPAYTLRTWVVAPYKWPLSLRTENRIFNDHVSKVRVRSEHAVAIINRKFGSLRGLRISIKNAETHVLALSWIKACIVLHTLIFGVEKGYESWAEQDVFILEGQGTAEAEEGYEGGGYKSSIKTPRWKSQHLHARGMR